MDRIKLDSSAELSVTASVNDLTTHIFNTSQLAVAGGGFSDVFVGELMMSPTMAVCKVNIDLT
jgi:hypothetical protein